MHQDVLIALSVIGLVATACQWFAWWIKLPAIVFLLMAGIVLGPLTGYLNPDALFGDLLFPFVSLSVAIILFEGSLTLKFDQIRGLQQVVRNMLTIGVAVIWTIITLATHYLLHFDWSLSLLFGAIMVVTGPTVIVPMLRTVRPNATISNILKWEGIAIDPIGAILAVLVFEFILLGQGSGHASLGHTFLMFGETLIIGTALGAVTAYLLGLLLRHHLIPEYLHNVAALTLVFGVFTLSNQLTEESGLLAVTVMGLWLANMKDVDVEDILDFKESLSVLLISGLFILLAARLDFDQFTALGWGGVGVFLVIQFIARPIKVWVCTYRSSLTWQEKSLISWIGPRGIVAAAVSALFAIRLQEIGVENADLLVPLSFTIIIGTVLLQGATAKILARQLGVAEPESKGFLILGANPVARAIATALNNAGYRTLLTDSSWTNTRTARMEGLNCYYGNAVSQHADRHLDLIGLGNLLALTPQRELNVLAGLRYRNEFGHPHLFTISTEKDAGNDDGNRRRTKQHARVLFGDKISFATLASKLAQGATIKQTKLSDSFDYEVYQAQYGKNTTPLFAIDSKQRLKFFTAEQALEPTKDWTIFALVREEDNE